MQIFDTSGRFLDEWRNAVIPWGFWMTPQDEIWVCGSTPQVFMKFSPAGRLLNSGSAIGFTPSPLIAAVTCTQAISKGNRPKP